MVFSRSEERKGEKLITSAKLQLDTSKTSGVLMLSRVTIDNDNAPYI